MTLFLCFTGIQSYAKSYEGEAMVYCRCKAIVNAEDIG